MVEREAAIIALDSVIHSVELFLEAARRDRKPNDLNMIYKRVERELMKGWNEQAADFKKEWVKFKGDFFEAKGKKPSATKINDAWKRAGRRGNKRHEKALDKGTSIGLGKGAASAINDLNAGISFNLKDREAIKYLKKLGLRQVKGISKTSLNRIKSLIVNMAEDGASWKEIGKSIDGLIKGWKTIGQGTLISRGELIAVTEVGQAYEEGRQIVRRKFEKAGLQTEKAWYAVGDDRVCDICDSAEFDGWIPGNDEFSNGFMMPLAHPACRCDLSIGVVTLSV